MYGLAWIAIFTIDAITTDAVYNQSDRSFRPCIKVQIALQIPRAPKTLFIVIPWSFLRRQPNVNI